MPIRWTPELIRRYEELLPRYDLVPGYGTWVNAKWKGKGADRVQIHDYRDANGAIFLHRDQERRQALFDDLVALFVRR